jgi:LysM repeat protein
MEQPQQKSGNMVFVLVVSAIFLAVATFIAVTLVARRPSIPEPTPTPFIQQVTVGGIIITLNPDPNKAIYFPNETGQIPPVNVDPVVSPPTITPLPVPQGPTPTFPPPAPTRDLNPVIFMDYVVVQGDSLYSIAEAKNSSIELMAKHGIDAEDLIPGATLRLPYANPAYCPGTRAYVVRDKDTVFRIAAVFGTTVEAIAQLNGLDPAYTIRVTEVICIPV